MTQPTALYVADILEDAGKPADVAEKAAAELRRLHAQIAACEPYLKEGETPAERIERDHRDSLALMRLLAQEKTKNEVLLEALKAMLRDPSGCAFCDRGRPRKSVLTGEFCEHDEQCGFVLAWSAIAKAEEKQ